MSPVNLRDFLSGLIFVVIGALFVVGVRDLEVGSALRMGPGFFPLVLASILMLLGVVIAARSFAQGPAPLGGIPWRGTVLILTAPVIFGLTVRGLGLVAAVALSVRHRRLCQPAGQRSLRRRF